MFKLSSKAKALLSLALGIVLMIVGFGIQPLVQMGFVPPLVGAIIGVSLPLAIEEDQGGKLGVADVEALAQKVISILEASGKLTPKEEVVAEVAAKVVSALQGQAAQAK